MPVSAAAHSGREGSFQAQEVHVDGFLRWIKLALRWEDGYSLKLGGDKWKDN
jgi:hypothetical protein